MLDPAPVYVKKGAFCRGNIHVLHETELFLSSYLTPIPVPLPPQLLQLLPYVSFSRSSLCVACRCSLPLNADERGEVFTNKTTNQNVGLFSLCELHKAKGNI
jgi:hypothetical protein